MVKMAKLCKYMELNFKERKCFDYFISHSEKKDGNVYCRLSEWKHKKGVCPYDHSIIAPSKGILRKRLGPNQKVLGEDEETT